MSRGEDAVAVDAEGLHDLLDHLHDLFDVGAVIALRIVRGGHHHDVAL
jgi:hypothetical protein